MQAETNSEALPSHRCNAAGDERPAHCRQPPIIVIVREPSVRFNRSNPVHFVAMPEKT
jgi:hypothetical protein